MSIDSWPHAFVIVCCVGFVLCFVYKVAKIIIEQSNFHKLREKASISKKEKASWTSTMPPP